MIGKNGLKSLPLYAAIQVLFFSLQREFGGQEGTEELQGFTWRPNAEILRPVSGELLWSVCYLSGVCWGKATGTAGPHFL